MTPQRRVEHPKRVLIICQLDGFANSVRPLEFQRFLQSLGHEVSLADTYSLSRASAARGSVRQKLPGSLRPSKLALYANEAASKLCCRRWRFGRRHLTYHVLMADYRLRRSVLGSVLPLDDFDLVICQTPYDAGALTVAGSARTLYDCPTPWADELFDEGQLTAKQHERLRRREAELFERVDHLAFHWESYGYYALEHYGISGHNLMRLNWGCTPAAGRARFADPPRVVYLGSLGTRRSINVPQLARLSELYPHIDVYGGPPPDPRLGLNYLGYASPDILRQYQFGLITSSDDDLRRDGFSAKHLHYLAQGLPVLVPAWRNHLDLLRGSVPYTEQTFPAVISRLSDETEWQSVSDEAYSQAQQLTWEKNLRPLETLLAETSGSRGPVSRRRGRSSANR